jgi:para-aminobenzoate synthetase component 1
VVRKTATFSLKASDVKIVKQKMLNWANQFSIFCFLDNNGYKNQYNRFECLLGVNPASFVEGQDATVLHNIYNWQQQNKDWLLGHFSYDFKNALEPRLSSKHTNKIGFTPASFFCPEVVCYIKADGTALVVESLNADPEEIWQQINGISLAPRTLLPKISFQLNISKDKYLGTIGQLREHIAAGDCYEINFCSEGFAENEMIDPLGVFIRLNEVTPAPFAALYRHGERYMMCASPERYLFKQGSKIVSQPIKGTAKRGRDREADEASKAFLKSSVKELAENVMIVDLVRNDLARSCEVTSVRVEELCGIYSFPQVHQMISTVSGTLAAGNSFTDAIKYSFPMGSMTGAPKIKVMQLIEQYERTARGLYSGCVGYITPNSDFDFNVVIRSLFYNATDKYLSYQTGGAITFDSDPELEWEEMRLKALAMENIFSGE